MTNQELMNASSFIARRNLNEKVIGVTVNWDAGISKLTVTYYVDGVVSDEERELCELTLAELLAEFSDVKLADSQCLDAHSELGELRGLVYFRKIENRQEK